METKAENYEDPIDLVIAKGGTEFHRSTHPDLDAALAHGVRLSICLEERDPVLKRTAMAKVDGADDWNAKIDKHAAGYALAYCFDLLEDWPRSPFAELVFRRLKLASARQQHKEDLAARKSPWDIERPIPGLHKEEHPPTPPKEKTPTIRFEPTDWGYVLVITGRNDDELHHSVHKNKRRASANLARLRGALRPPTPSVKFASKMRTVDDSEISVVVDKHGGHHALLACMETLHNAPETELTNGCMQALADLWKEDMGSALEGYE